MAKPTMLKLALVIALSMAASSAFATEYSGATSIGGTSFSSSNKVRVYVKTDGTANSFDSSQYRIAGAHELGDKIVGAANSDSKLYFTTSTAGTATATACTITSATTVSGWTSM